MKPSDERLEFFLCFVELLGNGQRFLVFFIFFPNRFQQSVVVEFNRHLESLNGLTQFRGFSAGKQVDLLLNFCDFIIEFQQRLFGCFVVIQQVLAFIEILLALFNVELQFVLHGGIA